MQNYFNYFTEIEQQFQQRRGSLLMLSTLDWALIETWREGGVPLEAVLRGIDDAFDKHDAKLLRAKARVRKVNGLAWCAQSVMEAAQAMQEAAVGARPSADALSPGATGFEAERVSRYLEDNAVLLDTAALPLLAQDLQGEITGRLRALAQQVRIGQSGTLEALDETLTVLEERLVGALMTATPEPALVGLREQAARELAPYRGKMQAVQIKQVQQQFLHKRLLQAHAVPRLSLFYMSHE